MYLCYDVRGIQSYIFQVPRLRYIIGGSALIDRLDHDVVPEIASELGVELVFSAGGRGGFRVDDEGAAVRVQKRLLEYARTIGLDLRFGTSDDFSTAANQADRVAPYLPGADDLDGHPCPVSGLYPVDSGQDDAPGRGGRAHSVVEARIRHEGERLAAWFEEKLLRPDGGESPIPEALEPFVPVFFRDVSPGGGGDADDRMARAGAAAIGNRNRWAVVCMDGNDMGAQFRVAAQRWADDEPTLMRWLGTMSDELDKCAVAACRDGIRASLEEWLPGDTRRLDAFTLPTDAEGRPSIVLPIRPLVVGGDDIVAIVHPELAFTFVRAAIDSFRERSQQAAERIRLQGIELWPATGDTISISAGVLFGPVGLPLHSAIPYAESLLASAKGRGRQLRPDEGPVPACLDWEQLTEGLVDHPAARRAREVRFLDTDIDEIVELTRRPFTIDEFTELQGVAERYRSVPRTIRHQVLSGLRAGFDDRGLLRARLGKRHAALAADLDEGGGRRLGKGAGRWLPGHGPNGESTRTTDVMDALLLLQESERMEKETLR